jgi:hypothetical protein
MKLEDVVSDVPPLTISSPHNVQGYVIPKELMKEIYYYIFDKSQDGDEADGWELLEEIGKVVDIDKMLGS